MDVLRSRVPVLGGPSGEVAGAEDSPAELRRTERELRPVPAHCERILAVRAVSGGGAQL